MLPLRLPGDFPVTSSNIPVMTKEEKKARKALSKDVAAELRHRAKDAGWKVYQGWLFREDDGWFVDAWCVVEQRKTTITVHLKPMGIDPVFWDIVLVPQNRNQPLSFRMWGAWTIKAPERNEREIDDTGLDAPALTDCVLSIASQELVRTRENRSLESFIEFVRQRRRGARTYLAAIVCAHILRDDRDGAMSELLVAREARDTGGYFVGVKSFVDLAVEWLGANAPTRH